MKTMQVVLHALPDELLSVVKTWLSKGGFRAAVLRIGPRFSAAEVASVNELDADVSARGVPFRVCLTSSRFDLPVVSLHEFMTRNVAECIVDFGAMSDEGLKESSVSVSSTDSEQSAFWSSALKKLKSTTRSGLWAVSPINGARKFFNNKRYTEGAAKFAKSGRKLLPLAGWNFFEIDHDAERT